MQDSTTDYATSPFQAKPCPVIDSNQNTGLQPWRCLSAHSAHVGMLPVTQSCG